MTSQDPAAPRLQRLRAALGTAWARGGAALLGVGVFTAVTIAGNAVLNLESSRHEARRKVELVSFGSLLRARLTRELDAVLFLTSGLNSYLVVRGGNIRRGEMEAILARLHADSRHVRNFGVAVGYQLSYLYPIKGNERALGVDYRNLPAQWPGVKRVVDGGVPALVGPLRLVQGGRGLIYRVPVFVRGKYWGLISTVIDADSLFNETFGSVPSDTFELAARGRDGRGAQGDVLWGDARVFERADAERIEIGVPGGRWVVAVREKSPSADSGSLLRLRVLVWVLAAFLGWGAYALLVQRARLARLALYDTVTDLPNRILIEDRMNRAISAQRRNPSAVSALLFVDLDGFKTVNDRFGHRAGDAVLHAVAERARLALRDVDSVGRWGGDELVVVLENTDRQKIPEVIERLRRAVESPTEFAGQSLRVGASIGSAIVPDDGEAAADLIRIADRRMYQDKQGRKRSDAP